MLHDIYLRVQTLEFRSVPFAPGASRVLHNRILARCQRPARQGTSNYLLRFLYTRNSFVIRYTFSIFNCGNAISGFSVVSLPICSILFDFVRFCSILFDFVRFCSILFDFVRFCSILFDFVRFCSILFDLVRRDTPW